MVRLERESSNSLFDILEDWDLVLQAENIDLEELSRVQKNQVVLKENTVEADLKTQSSLPPSQVKRQTQRLEP